MGDMEDKAQTILEVLKKAQLQKIGQENGLPTFGTNKVLRARITEWAATTGNSLRVRKKDSEIERFQQLPLISHLSNFAYIPGSPS